MAVIGLIRVSTDRQEIGPEAQRQAITAWAMGHSMPVARWYEDIGVSGAAPFEKRPGLMAALESLAEGDALVVAKRDRLARDVVLTAMVERLVEKIGAILVSADGTGNGTGPEAQLMRHIMASFAAYERALISCRIKSALNVKRANGEHLGPVPFGWRLDKTGVHLERHEGEQEAVRLILALREGGASLRDIAAELAARGILSPRGAAVWMPSAVNHVIKRESSPAARL